VGACTQSNVTLCFYAIENRASTVVYVKKNCEAILGADVAGHRLFMSGAPPYEIKDEPRSGAGCEAGRLWWEGKRREQGSVR